MPIYYDIPQLGLDTDSNYDYWFLEIRSTSSDGLRLLVADIKMNLSTNGVKFVPRGDASGDKPIVIYDANPAAWSFNMKLFAVNSTYNTALLALLSNRQTLRLTNQGNSEGWNVSVIGQVEREYLWAPDAGNNFMHRLAYSFTLEEVYFP